MSSNPTSPRSLQWADQAHHANANMPRQQPRRPTTEFMPFSTLTSQIPLVDTDGWFPPTPRIPLRELPALPLLPLPLFRLHPTLTSVVFQWDVRFHPEPTQLTAEALNLPAFDSPADLKSFRLSFNPLAGTPTMDYACDVTVSTATPPDTPITIGRVFRSIHRAIYAPIEATALPQSDPYRRHVERAYHRRTSRRRTDVLRNVDLHMVGQTDDGLFFHGITVEEAVGPHAPYPVFRVVLKDYPPFA